MQPRMPQCQQCGPSYDPVRVSATAAELCNCRRAAAQPAGQAIAATPAPEPRVTQVPAPDVPAAASESNGAVDESARAKRPPRVQRMREEGEPEPPTEATAEATAEERAEPPAEAPAAQAYSPSPAPPQAGVIVQEQEMPSLVAADEAGAPTAPQPAASAQPPSPSAPPPSAPASSPTPGPADGLPWPLAPGAIVGGRYRVEMVVTAAPTPSDENIYRVSDQLGYERCWSCGTASVPSSEQPPERFCQQCGADMLARPYLMRERLLGAAEAAATGAADAEQSESAPGVSAFRQGARQFSVAPEEIERSPFPLGAHVVIASASDTGRERSAEANEDSVAQVVVQIEQESRAEPLALGIVADGLGGHASGSEASRAVVHTVMAHVLRELVTPLLASPPTRPTEDALKQVLRDSIAAANAALHTANAESQRDMGSTIVAALIYNETAYLANVGDSRAYVLDGAELRRLTTDHSLVEQLVAGGMIPPEERYTHPTRNQIYRSLGVGSGDELTVDLFTQRLRPGLRFLLCSDGLWEMVRDDELARILSDMPHPQGACDALVRAANAHGGEDNISALVLDVTG